MTSGKVTHGSPGRAPAARAAGTASALAPVLELHEITKHFGSQVAADRVSLSILPGEVHALVGENGAGKSTLIKILAGRYHPDAGAILVDGNPVVISSPHDSAAQGISFIHQEPALIRELSISENVTLGTPFARRRGVISWKAQHERARSALDRVALRVDPRRPLGELTVAEQQLVAIARVLLESHRIIVLDEVTAPLTADEVGRLFDLIRVLRDQRVAFLYVSHRLEEVLEIAARITVLRNGRRIATKTRAELDAETLTQLIVGKDPDERTLTAPRIDHSAPAVFDAINVSSGRLQGVSFSVLAGEVLGLAGLVGAGRTELLECIFGRRRLDRGEMLLGGHPYRPSLPTDAVALGVALVTEDRKRDGFLPDAPVWQNITLPWLKHFRRAGLLRIRQERRSAVDAAERFDVRARSLSSPMRELSGGNQQKAILARWLSRPLRLLLLDEPTHGVDIGAKQAIYRIIHDVAASGTAVIMVSSELEELELLCARVVLLAEGRVTGMLESPVASKQAMLRALFARQRHHEEGK